MQVLEVKNDKQIALFHKVLEYVYEGDENFIYPLENDIEYIFNPHKNPSFERGKAIRFIVMDAEKPIGRIAAFYDLSNTEKMPIPIGGVGFFECINDKEAAFLLLNTAKEWLMNEGLQGFDGPINFGERDRFWGLLIKSESTPAYLENYNPKYYQNFFEDFGCKKYIEQQTYKMGYADFDAKRFSKIAEWIMRKPGFTFKHFDMAKADDFAQDFVEVYNAAWVNYKNFEPVTKQKVLKNIAAMRHIMVEDFIWFAYVNGKPAGILVMVPDINAVLNKLNGKLDFLGRFRFLYYKRSATMTRVKGLVFGISPQFQKYGIETVLIYKFYKSLLKYPDYREVELAWVGSYNTAMQQVMKNMQAKISKIHYTYRIYFDSSIEFKEYQNG